jgi:hypothetical protein
MRMNCRLCSTVVLWWIAGWSLLGVGLANVALAACARTPAAAAALMGKSAEASVAGDGGGFRVTSMRWDPLLRRRWALVASCGHPEWPAVEVPVSSLDTSVGLGREQLQSLLPQLPVVRAGDVVQLWSREEGLRIEVGAVAEESGALGKTVRVRLMRRSTLGQQAEGQFLGVVRGPHDVEMQR